MTQSKIPSHDPVAVLRAELNRQHDWLVSERIEISNGKSYPLTVEELDEQISFVVQALGARLDRPTERAATQPAGEVRKSSSICGACGAKEGEQCRTRSDDQCDAGKHLAAPISEDSGKGEVCTTCGGEGGFERETSSTASTWVLCPKCTPAAPSVTDGDALPPLPEKGDYGHHSSSSIDNGGRKEHYSPHQMRAYGQACHALGRGAAVREYVDSGSFAARTPASVGSIGEDQQFHELAMNYRGANPIQAQAQYDALCAFIDARTQPAAVEPDCTEPNRAACPRHCQDFCNKAEEAKAVEQADSPAAADAGGLSANDRTTVYQQGYQAGIEMGKALAADEAGSSAAVMAGSLCGDEVHFVQHPTTKPCNEWTEVKADRFQKFVDAGFVTRTLYTNRQPAMGAGDLLEAAAKLLDAYISHDLHGEIDSENERLAAAIRALGSVRPAASSAGDLSAPLYSTRQDAARYRLLVEKFGQTTLPCFLERHLTHTYVADGKASIDGVIDAARASANGAAGLKGGDA